MKKRVRIIAILLLVLVIWIDFAGIGFTIKYHFNGCYGANSLGKIARRIEAFGDCKVPYVCTVDENSDKVIVLVDDGSVMKISGFSDVDYGNEFTKFNNKLKMKYKEAVELRQENICTDEGPLE